MRTNRREFLIYGAALAAPAVNLRAANARPAFGVIGTGERGRYLSRVFQQAGA